MKLASTRRHGGILCAGRRRGRRCYSRVRLLLPRRGSVYRISPQGFTHNSLIGRSIYVLCMCPHTVQYIYMYSQPIGPSRLQADLHLGWVPARYRVPGIDIGGACARPRARARKIIVSCGTRLRDLGRDFLSHAPFIAYGTRLREIYTLYNYI